MIKALFLKENGTKAGCPLVYLTELRQTLATFIMLGAFAIVFAGVATESAHAQAQQLTIFAPDGYAPSAVLQADTSGITGGGAFTYEWQRGKSSNNEFSGSIINVATYTLPVTLNSAAEKEMDLLRLIATRSGTTYTVTININRPAYGTVRFLQDGAVVQKLEDGAIVSIDISTIFDDNNSTGNTGGVATYMWLDAQGGAIGTEAKYTVSSKDVERTFVRVHVTYTDAIGFTRLFQSKLSGQSELLVQAKPFRNLLSALGAASAQQAVNAVGSHLLSAPAGGGHSSSAGSQTQIKINNAIVESPETILAALIKPTSDNRNRKGKLQELFSIDSFAVESSGGTAENRWNSWVRSSWTLLDGSPKSEGQSFSYEGQGISFYGGADKRLGKWRIGLAAGYQSSELDATFSGDNLRNDALLQTYYSVLPYAEYKRDSFRFRLVGGAGLGRTEIEEIGDNNCQVRVKSDWHFGGAEAEYLLLSGTERDFAINASFKNTGGNLESGQCRNEARVGIPGFQHESSEGSFGWRAAFGKGTDFSPYILMDFRKTFGDLSDDLSYDLGAGAEWLNDPWSVQAEARTQLGNLTTHRRHSINGVFLYDSGWMNAQWKAGVEQDAQNMDWINRWELGATSEVSVNTVGLNVYVERRQAFSGVAENKVGANIRVEFLSGR